MAHSNTLIHDLLKFIPRHDFESIVRKHGGNRYVKRFDCWQQLVTLLYSQAANRASLREIEQSMEVNDPRLYHLGVTKVKRSTLADANRKRPSEMFEALFYKLVERDLSPIIKATCQ
jgi:putative transposase